MIIKTDRQTDSQNRRQSERQTKKEGGGGVEANIQEKRRQKGR